MAFKTHRKRKVRKMRGGGTHGWGARKKHKKSGHRGGVGMAGTGKRADQRKTLVLKLYGNNYFGKQGITSKSTRRIKNEVINIRDIEKNLDSFIKKGIAKKMQEKNSFEINLSKSKVLGTGDVKNKLFIRAKAASTEAKEKIKKAGGVLSILGENKEG